MKDFDVGGGKKRLSCDSVGKNVAKFKVQKISGCAFKQCGLRCGIL
jgi:hypothetical protein